MIYEEGAGMKPLLSFALVGLATIALLTVAGCGTVPTPGGTVQADPTLPPSGPKGLTSAETLAPGVWKCPTELTGALFVGSLEGETYYFPDCYQADNIMAENRICFATSDAARAYGYGPCNRCP
jgi:hypothetical protein